MVVNVVYENSLTVTPPPKEPPTKFPEEGDDTDIYCRNTHT